MLISSWNYLAKSEAQHHEIVKDVCRRLEEQPGFLAHKDEVIAEYEATGPHEDRILTKMNELVNAYKRVIARHGLPDTFVEPKGD
jgi:DNA-binding Lrp family transcriptional regulator